MEIEQGGMNGLLWQPTHVERVFGADYAGSCGTGDEGDERVSSLTLENVYLKRITLLGYRSTFPVNIGVKFTDPDSNVYGMEATADGQRYAHITLARSSSTTPDTIYKEISSDATMMWRRQYPAYNRNNLMHEGVMKLQNGAGFLFVNQNHPAVHLIQTSKETLSEDCKNMALIDGEYYKISQSGMQHACEILASRVLKKVSNTNLNDFSVALAPVLDVSSSWDQLVHCDRHMDDIVSNCVTSHTEYEQLRAQRDRAAVTRPFLDMRFHWAARYEIEYSIPTCSATRSAAL